MKIRGKRLKPMTSKVEGFATLNVNWVTTFSPLSFIFSHKSHYSGELNKMSKQRGSSVRTKRKKSTVNYTDRSLTGEQIIVNLILYIMISIFVFIIAALGLIGGLR
jgi:hypothetical protein